MRIISPKRAHKVDRKIILAVHELIKLLMQEHEIEAVFLYGSWARGAPSPGSDVDIAIILKGERQDAMETGLAMTDVAYDVELETGVNLSPYPVWESDWNNHDKYSNPSLLRNIAREGIPIELCNL